MDGIIFDVDGTLWDSTDSVAESWNLAIRENSSLDLTIDGEILQGLFGRSFSLSVRGRAHGFYRGLF